MLRSRILTASIILPLAIWLIIYANYPIFIGANGIIAFIAGIEWISLSHTKQSRFLRIILGLIYTLLIGWLGLNEFTSYSNKWHFGLNDKISQYNITFFIAFCYWIFLFLNISFFSIEANFKKLTKFCEHHPLIWQILADLSGILILTSNWLAINYMKKITPLYLLIVMFMVISVDCGGYIGGKLHGKHKISIISPNKTLEGLIGGTILGFIISIGIFINTANYLVAGLFLAIFMLGFILAVTGDLCESLLKRIAKVKDSGHILPGHGGILDRIDSLLAVTPFCALMLELSPKLAGFGLN